jgi:hypothetical protein
VASVKLSFEQVLEAARRLPADKRKILVQALEDRPRPKDVLKVARRLRPQFRLPAKKRKRLSLLLQKGNAGTLTPEERKEVDALVEEVDIKMLEFAEAIDAAIKSGESPKGRNGAARRR